MTNLTPNDDRSLARCDRAQIIITPPVAAPFRSSACGKTKPSTDIVFMRASGASGQPQDPPPPAFSNLNLRFDPPRKSDVCLGPIRLDTDVGLWRRSGNIVLDESTTGSDA
jgi:hypothetical protein